LDKWEDGLNEHRRAVKTVQDPWQAVSIEEQAIRLARLVGHTEQEIQKLADIYEGREVEERATSSSD
jgi:hypothetical protein